MEKELLGLIFTILDKTEFDYPQLRDETLDRLRVIYNTDMVDVTNTYINYTWSDKDNVSGDNILRDFLTRTA